MEKDRQQQLLHAAGEWFVDRYGGTPEQNGYSYGRFWYKRVFWMEIPSVIYASTHKTADEYIKEQNFLIHALDCSVIAVFMFIVGCYCLFCLDKSIIIVTTAIVLIAAFFIFVFWLVRKHNRISRKYEKKIIVVS